MKDKRKYVRLISSVLLCILLFSITSYAGDATEDILTENRFNGAITWINKFGQFVDQFFVGFISFISFFIISASCLRNVLAGAYCVFPKFWDKVDEAHKNMESISIASVQSAFSGGAWKNNVSTGSFTQFLLRLLPNVKVLTDFEDAQDPDYKQYFMRAIPQCVLAVFVGVFIYNGYYRQVMVVTSKFGSEVVSQALTSVKPDEILYKLTNISGTPEYQVKDAKDGLPYIADQMVKSIQGHVLNLYEDQNERGNKADCFARMSEKCYSIAKAKFAEFENTDVWKVKSVDSNYQIGKKPDLAADYVSSDGMTKTYTVSFDVSELGLKTEYHKGEDVYIWIKMTFRNSGAKDENVDDTMLNDLILHLPPIVNNSVTYCKGNETKRLRTGTGIKIGDTEVTITASKIDFKGGFQPKVGQLYQASGLAYESNQSFNIVGVVFEETTYGYLTSDSTGLRFDIGDSIEDKWNTYKRGDDGKANTGDTDSNEDTGDEDDLLEGAD